MLHEFKIQPFTKEINTPNSRIVYRPLNFTVAELQLTKCSHMSLKRMKIIFHI